MTRLDRSSAPRTQDGQGRKAAAGAPDAGGHRTGSVAKRLRIPTAKAAGAMLRGCSAPLVLGFALCQTWNILCIALPDPITYAEPFHDLRWVSLTVCVGLLALSAIWSRKAQALLQRKRALVALGALASLGSFLGPASALQPDLAFPLIYIAAVAVGVGFAWLFLAWYNVFCLRHDLMGLALSVAVTAVLAYGLANVLTTDLVNTWVSAAIGSALPLASMGLLIAGTAGLAQLQPRGATDNRNRAGGADAEEKSRVASDGQQDVKRQPPSLGALLPSATLQRLSQRNRSILLRFCLCLLIAITAVEAVRNLLLSGTALTFYAGAANLLGLGLKLASTAWLLYLFETYDVRGVSAVYRVAFLMMLGVVLCIPSLLAGNWLAHTLLDLASYFFQVTMLVVAYQICVGFRVNPVMVFSLFRAVWALAALAGIGLGHAIASAHTPLGIQALTVGMGLAVAFAFTFAFTDRDCVKVLAAMPKRPAASPFRDKMRQVASRFALSERELEVMTLVAKGRSAARIADDLSVSPATVNSHVSHIYRKLGVHSRQQLLDLVERG